MDARLKTIYGPGLPPAQRPWAAMLKLAEDERGRPVTATEFAECSGITESGASRRLSKLRQAGVVTVTYRRKHPADRRRRHFSIRESSS